MKATRLWRHLALSLIVAGLAGGFILGLLNPGDPDPNPIGRTVYACMIAGRTVLHAGFPPHDKVGAVVTLNAWPYIAICFLLIFGWLAYRDSKSSTKRSESKA